RNRTVTITLCAVDNAAMSALTSKGYTISTLKNILSLHVLLDYFGAKKLHQIGGGSALAATLFQATGAAPGTTGFVSITMLRGGKESVEGGMTVFCPGDDAMKGFLPKYKNLTAPKKEAFLSFLAVPTYYSMAMLKSNNGPMNTLATDGANKFELTVQNDGEKVTLTTRINTVQIVNTLIDEQPLAIYATDKVLLPKELFKALAVEAPAPAPAPEDGDVADAPIPAKGKAKGKKKKAAPLPDDSFGESHSPAEGPDGDADDESADEASAVRIVGGAKAGFVVGLLCMFASSWLI
ncbi:unnamed protein product, partial [Brassica napus]